MKEILCWSRKFNNVKGSFIAPASRREITTCTGVHKRYLLCTFARLLLSSSSCSGSLSLSSFEKDSQRFVARRRGRQKSSSQKKGKGGGSRSGKSQKFNQNRVLYNQLLMADYFAPNTTYGTVQLRCRFRMRRSLFDTILAAVLQHDPYFAPGFDCCALEAVVDSNR